GGVVEYAGRIDHQVKIRGFRIELGEIEARVKEHPAVRETVVLDVDGPTGKQLVAYVLPVDPSAIAEGKAAQLGTVLRKYLVSCLTDYMVPAHFVMLDMFPLTPNGKLDKKRLPAPDIHLKGRTNALLRTRLERQLASIWQDVLGIEGVGLGDDFFEVGGNSILMLSALGKIREHIDGQFAMHEFMKSSTLEAQADALRNRMEGCQSSLVKINTHPATKPGLYCLPPAGGTTFPYYPLAKALGAICPVYALLHRGFIENGFHYESWDEMVTHYLGEITQSQPTGPYSLLGWSSGGALAIEIAHRLEASGETVNVLALVDTMLPQTLARFHKPEGSDEQVSPVSLADLGERNLAAMIMIRGFFPEQSDEDILLKVLEGRKSGFQDDALVDFMLDELSARRGENADVLKAAYHAYAKEAEFAVGYDIYGNIAALTHDFSLRPLNVRPHLWWSSVSRNNIDELEALFIASCSQCGVAASERLDTPHERMVYVPEFLNGLSDHIGKCL
ncbi:thioesterase domain-containing protein, partial [Pseudomonas sp. 3A(2025)]